MPPEDRDPSYLWDMLTAARSIRHWVRDMTYAAFVEDLRTRLALRSKAVQRVDE
jgi:uncharacterized protein with HEPN domain